MATVIKQTVRVKFHDTTLYCDVQDDCDDFSIVAVRCDDNIMPLLDHWKGNSDLERFYDEVHYEYKWGRR